MPRDSGPGGRSNQSATFGAGLVSGFRGAWSTERGRRRIVISAGLIVAVMVIAIAAVLFASLAGESQSYRDGYSAGGAAFTAYGQSRITSDQACRDEEVGPGGRPARDNPAQWVQGCADAFNLAASDN
jgi:hypothetical protein